MVQRKCPKCNILFNRKSHYDSHINRKNDCKSNKLNLDENLLLCQNMPFCAEIVPKYAETCKTDKFILENDEIIPIKSDTSDIGDDEINKQNFIVNLCCHYCKKKFSSKSTLKRHVKVNCKAKRENDLEKESIFKLLLEKDKENKERINQLEEQNKLFEKQNKILMDKIDKLINRKDHSISSKTINNNQKITNNMLNNTTNSNNTQNIVMVNFGKEDLSIIDERQFIDRIIKKPTISGVKIPDEVLKIIHFNPQYPQLSNIYISDINREKCMVYEEGEWKLSSIDNIPQIIDKVCIFSADQINTLKTKYPNNKSLHDRLGIIEKYNNMIDEDYIQDLRDDESDNKNLIKRCEDFQKHTYNTLKKTLYNEGKKLKKK
jgi:hypothetical protein